MAEQESIRRIDRRRLSRSGFGDKVLLVLSAELGLVVGTIFSAGLLGPLAIFGVVIVPIFGFTMGYVGLSRARANVVQANGTKILPNDHALTKAVHQIARELSLHVMPMVGIYPDKDINAFAAGSGPDRAVVSFSQGLIDACTPREVLAIATHEVGHIVNNDMRRMQLAWSFQNALTWYMMVEGARQMARWALSTVGEMLILKLSRTREYWADAISAGLLGKDAMIEALRRLGGDPVQPSAKNLAYARLMIRSNPHEWFATHPTIENRIYVLEKGIYTKQLPYRSDRPEPSQTAGLDQMRTSENQQSKALELSY